MAALIPFDEKTNRRVRLPDGLWLTIQRAMKIDFDFVVEWVVSFVLPDVINKNRANDIVFLITLVRRASGDTPIVSERGYLTHALVTLGRLRDEVNHKRVIEATVFQALPTADFLVDYLNNNGADIRLVKIMRSIRVAIRGATEYIQPQTK